MAEIKILKIGATGVQEEHDSAADDLTMNQFTVDGGLVASSTGIDMNNGNISDADNLAFTDPATDGITTTSNGTVAADDLMAIDIENTMTAAGGIAFPGGISDAVGEVDALRLPAIAAAPTAAPSNGGEGHIVWDSTNDFLYVWDGASWVNQSISSESARVCDDYTFTSAASIGDVVYIDAADSVDLADVSSGGPASRVVGMASAAVLASAVGKVCSDGVITGLSGLTAGARYFADPSTAGGITSTVPAGAGNVIYQIGFAKSATEIHLQLMRVGRRAA